MYEIMLNIGKDKLLFNSSHKSFVKFVKRRLRRKINGELDHFGFRDVINISNLGILVTMISCSS